MKWGGWGTDILKASRLLFRKCAMVQLYRKANADPSQGSALQIESATIRLRMGEEETEVEIPQIYTQHPIGGGD